MIATQKEKIEKLYLIPCGPTDISADSVCRRSLSSGMDKILDRLTEETNPEIPPPAKLGKGLTYDESGKVIVEELDSKENRDEKKQRLIEEGKLRAEVNQVVKQYRETLQGNSKLLQDITGVIHPHTNP